MECSPAGNNLGILLLDASSQLVARLPRVAPLPPGQSLSFGWLELEQVEQEFQDEEGAGQLQAAGCQQQLLKCTDGRVFARELAVPRSGPFHGSSPAPAKCM